MTSPIREAIRRFLAQTFPGRALADGDDLFALGFGNSLFAMQLVDWLESAFGIVVENDDLEMDNFRSVDRIVQLVDRKQAAPRVAQTA